MEMCFLYGMYDAARTLMRDFNGGYHHAPTEAASVFSKTATVNKLRYMAKVAETKLIFDGTDYDVRYGVHAVQSFRDKNEHALRAMNILLCNFALYSWLKHAIKAGASNVSDFIGDKTQVALDAAR
jgi:pyrrolidone-carboxylate peptidase